MVKAVLFDIGNVLVQWDPRHLYRKLLPDEAAVDRFLNEICTLDWHLAHDAGVSFEANAALLKQRFPDHVALIDAWGARYLEMTPGAVAGMAALFEDLEEAGVPLHGLTNMPSTIYPLLQDQYPMLGRFRSVVVSGDEKVCKPDPKIFEIALDRMGLAPQDVFFVDDTRVNVDAASTLGFDAHQFQSAEGLRAALVERKLLPS